MSRKLNILILSPFALENGRGGEISSMELASGLNKFYNVTLMDTNIFTDKELLSPKIIKTKIKGLENKKRLKFATLTLFNRIFNCPYPLELIKYYRIVKNQDIIYSSFFDFKSCLLIIFFKLLHRKGKFIVGYRKPLYSQKLFSLYNLKYRMAILFFSKFKKSVYHHTMSYHARKFLKNFYDSNSIIHITHGIELEKFDRTKIEVKKDDILNFLYLGYLDDIHKGITVLVDAIDEFLKENQELKVFFEFCGMGPLDFKIIELEKKYPDHVKFSGYISNDLIPLFYKKSDVFLFSSRVEPFPRTIMEALASNLIIICTKTIGSVELLKGKKFAFFIPKLNTNEIKLKILEIYNLWIKNPIKFRELQNLAKEYVFKNYSLDKELEEFKIFIDKITN
ncbi:MAG: glycosyltransferase family 4 protein [Candidatus Hermodarchaeota archaeon]